MTAFRFSRLHSLPAVLVFVAAIFAGSGLRAQVEVSATAGNPGPVTYTTLELAFAAVNNGTHKGDVVVEITADVTETATAVLHGSGTGAADYDSLAVIPSGEAPRTISGAIAGAPLVDLDGADYVAIDGLDVKGPLWGGNLAMLCSLLGTPHWPRIKGGVLFVEDVNEHPYRIERSLLQLHQAGVLDAQKAILLGAFTEWKKSPLDRGYTLKSMVQTLRGVTRTPILTGLPFGHVPTKVTLPVGARVELVVQARDVLVGWG